MASKAVTGCALKTCKEGPFDAKCARVEVKTAVPRGGIDKYRKSLIAHWKKNGEASFHRSCWDKLYTAAKQRRRKAKRRSWLSVNDDDDGGLNITDSEKVMIKEASKTIEMFDSSEDIRKEAERIATMMKNAKQCVFFTGAGISTAAGLGDFRGKGGKWTEQDRETVDMDSVFDQTWQEPSLDGATPTKRKRTDKEGKDSESAVSSTTDNKKDEEEEEDEQESIAYEFLRPTYTHEAIQKLMELGYIKYLISQNCDGLHLLSGVPAGKISELHGNVFVEKCEDCGTRYERSFYVCDDVADVYLEEVAEYGVSDVIAPEFMLKCVKCGLSHRTGRKCEKGVCGGPLMDTIINFRDNLEDEILDRAFDAAKPCDLLVCLGTTLLVTPAADIVDHIKRPHRIVICNRQATDRDQESLKTDAKGNQLGARVYGDCDTLMKHLMKCMLGKEEFSKFEASLPSKAELYNKKRNSS